MKAQIAGGELSYDVRGSGPALLLLHAFPLSLAMWEPQLEALAARATVVRFDCRGFGASPAGDGLLTMERIADDGAQLIEHLGLGSAVVCGLSMGGYAAFAFVRRHASRLRGLVLADTRAGADTEETRANRARLAERVRQEGSAAAADALLPGLVGKTTHAERPELRARVRAMILANTPRGIADALAGLAARADSAPTLREVKVPTLVACGEEDTLTPLAESEALVRGIAGSRLATIPQAGHLANMENAKAFNTAVTGFLAQLPG